jgi:hypothetical protein
MKKFSRPEGLQCESDSATAEKDYRHWLKTFMNFTSSITEDSDKLTILTNFVSPTIFELISECTSFDSSIAVLNGTFLKPKNEVFARYLLATRRPQMNESLNQYIQSLGTLSRDCNYKAVTSEQHRSEAVRDAFISGLQSQNILTRLLENVTLTLDDAIAQAKNFDSGSEKC